VKNTGIKSESSLLTPIAVSNCVVDVMWALQVKLGCLKLYQNRCSCGVRRVEALTGAGAMTYLDDMVNSLKEIKNTLSNPKDVQQKIVDLLAENKALSKALEHLEQEKVNAVQEMLLKSAKINKDGILTLFQGRKLQIQNYSKI
jgi:alanyl-tRNA synthetase